MSMTARPVKARRLMRERSLLHSSHVYTPVRTSRARDAMIREGKTMAILRRLEQLRGEVVGQGDS